MRKNWVYESDFTSGLDSGWELVGRGSGDEAYDRANAEVINDVLTVWTRPSASDQAYRGGNAILQMPLLFAEVHIRARVQPGNKYCALLWPDAHPWPPEIDFFEGGNSILPSQQTSQTLHYCDPVDAGPNDPGFNKEIHTFAHNDFTRYHDIALIWREGVLQYLVDGVVTGHVMSEFVPDIPMKLHLQSAHKGGSLTTKFEISRVRVAA